MIKMVKKEKKGSGFSQKDQEILDLIKVFFSEKK